MTMKTKTLTSEKSQSTANATDNKSYSEDREIISVENTPFTIVRQDALYYVLMGNFALDKELTTKEEAIEKANEFNWTKIMQVIAVMMEKYETQKTNINN